ncbi:PIG-L family deacetylase [Natroniella sulfidigena]|uniref:PIG-L deacetylase family protein n=1 Tax=Natroniella sulfidigena TaxID=723921 RepID=UPI00200B9A3B|nr:PIG-L family deacetylase [Natroniella sulfidigena]MCK8816315.1 PIG-L family deacetylase [Natroniella sulfidigena]
MLKEIRKNLKWKLKWKKYNFIRKYIGTNHSPKVVTDEIDDILVLAPHPDDGVIGCGGTMAKYINLNQDLNLKVIYITDGRKAGEADSVERLITKRKSEAEAALNSLGVNDFEFFDIKDGKVYKNIIEIKRRLESILPNYKHIFTPFIEDGHKDHQFTTLALYQVLQGLKIENIKIWNYEVWSPTIPNSLIDITDSIEQKKRAISFHESQLELVDYVEKIVGLNAYRSIKLDKEVKFCEGFLKLDKEAFINVVEESSFS